MSCAVWIMVASLYVSRNNAERRQDMLKQHEEVATIDVERTASAHD